MFSFLQNNKEKEAEFSRQSKRQMENKSEGIKKKKISKWLMSMSVQVLLNKIPLKKFTMSVL